MVLNLRLVFLWIQIDDDSDLEFELEISPPARGTDTSQAAEYVKGLMPACFSSECGRQIDSAAEVPSAVEAARNSSTSNSTRADKDNIISADRSNETLGGVPGNKKRRVEVFKGNKTTGAEPASKKRKVWTEEEDMELIAAVQKFGEGNWVTILKGAFKHDRTAAQLSQRWHILKKRQSNSNARCSIKQSEALDATRLALGRALNTSMVKSFSVKNAGTIQIKVSEACKPLPPQTPNLLQETRKISSEASNLPQEAPKGNVSPSNKLESIPENLPALVKPPATGNSPIKSVETQQLPQEASNLLPVKGKVTPLNKPQSNSMIKAAAVAAGGRVLAASAAALLTATQLKNAVHIRVGSSQLMSKANKGQKQFNSHHSPPFARPPPLGNLLKISNGLMASSNLKRDSRSLAGNAKKTNVKETSDDKGDGMKLDCVLNQDQGRSLDVGEEDRRVEKDGDVTEKQV
ncbi:uncharacterized protein LOC109836532 isoform X2 [Asparagus officinalis]|uniref:uncharacterized protein LOC109836532 isoform X2 n=1 Tax=Asparagus officinalis TaxID=4686 RepID=UPI00098E2119|nr:uncharacterized protein LOC109836532 isoform X2 [Asparagus officinalis]